jgi:hypothetical protein
VDLVEGCLEVGGQGSATVVVVVVVVVMMMMCCPAWIWNALSTLDSQP